MEIRTKLKTVKNTTNIFAVCKKPRHTNAKKNEKLALKLGIQTYQILTNDDEVCIPSLSSILLAVQKSLSMKCPLPSWELCNPCEWLKPVILLHITYTYLL